MVFAAPLFLIWLALVSTVLPEAATGSPLATFDGAPGGPTVPVFLREIPYIGSYAHYLHGSRLKFYAGKLHSMARHFRYELESTRGTVPLIRHVNYICSQYGVWLGATCKTPLSDAVELDVEGWKLIPIPGDVYGSYLNNSNPQAVGDLPDGMQLWRKWAPTTNAWYADLHVTASPGLENYVNGIGVVLGARFDKYRRVMHQEQSRGQNLALDGDEMEMNAHMFIPYVGVQVSRETSRLDMAIRMIGTPMVFGGIQHRETFGVIGARDEAWFSFDVPRGYWAELFVEGGVRVSGQVALGGFLKMTTMTLMSNADLTRTSLTGEPALSDNYDLVFRRLNYAYGATLALRF